MSINQLHIFSKDTDAPESQAGFEYQKLKTLETWVFNKVNGIEEDIYCDYEEDIFQKGIHDSAITFRQIKLYSTNFSFSAEEVHKALQHFFMLYVKSDYTGAATEFIFEANSDIARKKGDNDAELMREWRDNQGNLNGDLLDKCRAKTKGIITDYIEAAYKKLYGNTEDAALKKQLGDAKFFFYALQPADFDKFVNSIKWHFEGITPYQALENIKARIAGLLEQIPFIAEKEEYKFAHGHLLTIISEKSIGMTPADRKLTGLLLDHALLQLGSKEDIWYSAALTKWNEKKTVTKFLIGEFFEVVDASKYCRWNKLVHGNMGLWEKLLSVYFGMDNIIVNCKRKAIYESFMMKMQIGFPAINLGPEPERLIQFYFNNLTDSETSEDLEDAINLHQVVSSINTLGKLKLPEKEVVQWFSNIQAIITKKLQGTENPNSQCVYYELLGHASFKVKKENKLIGAVKESIEWYNKIIPLLPQATMYNIGDLSGKLRQMRDLILRSGFEGSNEAEKQIKTFLEKIESIVQERKGKHFTAQQHVKWGAAYLEKHEFGSYLDALEEFHKAKVLWNQEKTIEGVIISMMMIARVYQALGMNYAAKYYAMTALWDSFHINTKNLKRISGCFGIIMVTDFESGAWISALNDFEKYITSSHMFDAEVSKDERNEYFNEAVSKEGLLLLLIPQFSSDLTEYVESKKKRLGWFKEETIDPLIVKLQETFAGDDMLSKIVSKLSDFPINDAGTKRKITWATQSHSWTVEFDNEWQLNAIAEELCAVMQIMQVEISRRTDDMHFIKANITIRLEKSTDGKFYTPKKQASNSDNVFTLFIPVISTVSSAAISDHYVHLAGVFLCILKDISLLPGKELDEIVGDMFKQGLVDKTLIVNSYQLMLKDFFSESDFVERTVLKFSYDKAHGSPQKAKHVLPVTDDRSSKYLEVESIQNIQNRNIVFKRTLHLSVDNWKKEEPFKQLIRNLRKDGWLDWQILTALNSHVISHKTNLHLKDIRFANEESHQQNLRQEFDRMMKIDEEYCFEEIPVSNLLSAEFNFLLKQVPVFTLNSYGLENGSAFPDHEAIKSLLVSKFNFAVDDLSEDNLLADVK